LFTPPLKEHLMALIIISLLVIVPLALLVWDTSRNATTYNDHANAFTAADVEPNAPRAMGSAIRVHA
jgi:hypothetical protein